MPQELERKELDTLLASPYLQAPRIRETLKFLCECRWNKDQESVTQYDIAEAVLGNVDDVAHARNYVMRLRNQLKLHYADNKNDPKLLLEIPLGSYKIIFRRLEPDSPPSSTELKDKVDAPLATPGAGRRKKLLLAAALAGVSLVLSLALAWWAPWFGDAERSSPAAAVPASGSAEGGGKAVSIIPQGTKIVGYDEIGDFAWKHDFHLPVRDTAPFQKTATSPCSFLVLYGARQKRSMIPGVSPHLAFVSAGGTILEEIDLLDEFNPYPSFDPRMYTITLHSQEDLDQDGLGDLIIDCRHYWYPDIIYLISGSRMECVAGFGNSGYVKRIAIASEFPGKRGSRPVGVLAVNNMMGEQQVFFKLPFSMFAVSPDHDYPGTGDCRVDPLCDSGYRPTGRAFIKNWSLKAGENLVFSIGGAENRMEISRNKALRTDPWHGSANETIIANEQRRSIYANARDARRLIRNGRTAEGQQKYEIAARIADESQDDGITFFIQLDAARAFKRSGQPARGLAWLPENPDSAINPRRVQMLKGHLQMLQGKYLDAKNSYLAANHRAATLQGFIHASILAGATPLELYDELSANYPAELEFPVVRSWLLLAGIMQNDLSSAQIVVNRLSGPVTDKTGLRSAIRYPQELAIWTAYADLAKGDPPTLWPDQDERPPEDDPLIGMKINLLEAYRTKRAEGADAAISALHSAYQDLSAEAAHNENSIIPFALAAFEFGFAATAAGESDQAHHALSAALELYPHGARAERARQLLAPPR